MTLPLPRINAYQKAKLSAEDYWILADAGAFEGMGRVELIEGELFVVNATWQPHARAHAMLTVEIGMAIRASGLALEILATPATALSSDSVPEPDIVIADRNDSPKALPGQSVRIAVEISESTLRFDLGRKARLYARNGVPEYWVVDVKKRQIHQMWQPDGDAYAEKRTISFGQTIASALITEMKVDTAALL